MSRDQLVFSRSAMMIGSAKSDIKRPDIFSEPGLAHEFKALVSPLKIKQDGNEAPISLTNNLNQLALESAECETDNQTNAISEMLAGFIMSLPSFTEQYPPLARSPGTINSQLELKDQPLKNLRADFSEPVSRKSNGVHFQKQVSSLPGEPAITSGLTDKKLPEFAQDNLTAKMTETLVNAGPSALIATQQSQTAATSAPPNAAGLVIRNVQVENITKHSAGKLTSIELALEPAELGRITARLEFGQDRLVLQVTTENKQAAELLAQDSGLLLRALSHHIGNVENLSVIIRQDGQELAGSSQRNASNMNSKQQGDDKTGANQSPVFEQNKDAQPQAVRNRSNAIKTGILI